jgi:hypothetical protein
MEVVGNRRVLTTLPGGGYSYALRDEGVAIEVRRLRWERYQLFGEVDVLCQWHGVQAHQQPDSEIGGSLSCADLNLSAQSAREARAKFCQQRARSAAGAFDWIGAIDDACREVIRAERHGEDAIVLDDAPAAGPPADFDVFGLKIPADSHSQLVADGSGMKSMLLLLILGTLAQRGIPVALLDGEWNAERHLARKRRVFGDARLECLYYRRSKNSLSVERDHIRRFCDDKGIQFIGIDSISAVCDGKLADDDVARAYNRALDGLPPSLAAAHVPKSTDPAADLKMFGSAFFHNFARQTWSVRKVTGQNDDVVTVMLVPHKQNDGKRLLPVALEFNFEADRIDVRNVEPTGVQGLSESLPLRVRMMPLLKRGPLTIVQLADELGAKQDAIVKVLQRSQAFTKLTNCPDGVHRIALVERRVS